jgi:uncharacterized protein with HEPN domain
MSKRQPSLLIEDIIDSGNKILAYTADLTIEQFLEDDKTVDAVIRNFEIIGEAAGNLPEEFRSKHADIDWRRIKGFRNRIVHEYFGIDYEIVWKIKETFLHEMLQKLSEIKE